MEADVNLDAQAHGFDAGLGEVGICGAIGAAVKVEAKTLALQETLGYYACGFGFLSQALSPSGQSAVILNGSAVGLAHLLQHFVK